MKMKSAQALADQHRGAVDRGQQERVEAALLALGHEQTVDAEHRGEQQRDRQHPGRELPASVSWLRPKWKIMNVITESIAIAGHGLQRAQLEQQVLAQDRARRSSCVQAP